MCKEVLQDWWARTSLICPFLNNKNNSIMPTLFNIQISLANQFSPFVSQKASHMHYHQASACRILKLSAPHPGHICIYAALRNSPQVRQGTFHSHEQHSWAIKVPQPHYLSIYRTVHLGDSNVLLCPTKGLHHKKGLSMRISLTQKLLWNTEGKPSTNST